MKKYQIVDSATRGQTLIATRDMKPGELIFLEKQPLMSFSHSFCSKFERNFDSDLFFALPAFKVFQNDMSPEKQLKFLSLYGPTTGSSAENFQQVGRDHCRVTPEELETFVHVAQIARLNTCGDETSGYKIFEISPRLAHSCAANCECVLQGRTSACHAKRFIRAGEVLSVCYVQPGDLLPIHERRYKYLQRKEFICHCLRCDAIGDDTRQFDCSDPACQGVMMVCQPISQATVDLFPTDIAYVEPHLLPCTICHCTATTEYQTQMFDIEKKLPNWYDRFQTKFENDELSAKKVLNKLLRLKFPRRHAAAIPLLMLEYKLKFALYLDCNTIMAPVAQEAFLQFIAVLEHIIGDMHRTTAGYLHELIRVFFKDSAPPIFSPQQEKELSQKALRMHLLLFGRDKRNEILESATARALRRLPPIQSTKVCSFCEESPLRADIKLGGSEYSKLAYCCFCCQVAHWEVHRPTCQHCSTY